MLYRMFVELMDNGLVCAVVNMPKNLRQYYADKMLLRVQIEFGVNP